MGIITSYFKALKASGNYGSAIKQRNKGKTLKALNIANKGLSLLSLPGVIRNNPAESSVIINLTIFVEEVASEIGKSGAAEKDLKDTYNFIGDLEGTEIYNEFKDWLQYIENKLGYKPT